MKYDVIVIGGNPAGSVAASVTKQLHNDKSVLVIRKEPESLIPCGIPYVFGTLPEVEDDIKPIGPAKQKGIEFLFDEVTAIDTENKTLTLRNNEQASYTKLVIATGSTPFVPPIEGKDFDGVFTIKKEIEYIKSIREPLKNANNIVIVGAGFIGIEMSDELVKISENVTLIESMDSILPLAFDKEMIAPAVSVLEQHGVTIRTGTMVKRITGKNNKVTGVEINTGEIIPADAVILAIGYRPNTTLAKDAGLDIGIFGGIITDEYLRTSVSDIFAVGDCAEHRDFFTRKQSRLMLASTGASEARVAGMNIFDLKVIRQHKGSIAIFSSSLDEIAMGAAGLTETQAANEDFHYIVGTSTGMDHHPGKLPGAKIQMKLLFSTGSGVLLGAQIIGGKTTGEMINILGLAIQKSMTAAELATMQYGTQPLLTAGPGIYPIVLAAINALEKMQN
jgi:NADPH-dependent 2,4-dienoyl-CoA reductase/sulfur reductase-like enzyme